MIARIAQLRPWIWIATVLLLAGVGVATRDRWLPQPPADLPSAADRDKHPHDHDTDHPHDHPDHDTDHSHGHPGDHPDHDADHPHDHEGTEHPDDHDHPHPGHSGATSIELSDRGLKNIGYRPVKVKLGSFTRTITVPAMVVERPGRSQIYIPAPLTGIITRIHPIQGAAVEPGSLMFEVRLTHEELVAAQRDLIRTAESLDVVKREIERLQSIDEGVVARRRIVEQQYEKQKLEASLTAERQALLLHGFDEQHIDSILGERRLIQSLTVTAPAHADETEACSDEHLFHVQQLPVQIGQQVEAGQVLCVLADHCELYVEGRAFADDADRLRNAVRNDWSISASLLSGDQAADHVEGLKLLYLADHVDPDSRAFHFYCSLANQVVMDRSGPGGQRFIEWRFKPGQRMELEVPVQHWQDRIVLPVEAIVEDGAEIYVYRRYGHHFDRRPVHVEYRSQRSVVIANDGSLKPGDVIAARGAYQLHLALKSKAGGGADPHHGHSH